MKVSIVGSIPPPVGGISIHIKRIKRVLEVNGIESCVYNEGGWGNRQERIYPISRYRSFIFKIPFIQADLLHIHSIDMKLRILLGAYKLFGKKIILTIHGESLSDQLKTSNALMRFLLRMSLKKIDKVICVNQSLLDELILLGMDNSNMTVIPGYIHPKEYEEDVMAIPQNVHNFIEKSPFLITANGCIRFYKEEDLYGVDMLINMMYKLKNQGVKAHLLFALLDKKSQTAEEREYYKELQDRLRKLDLEENFMFYEVENTELYPILQKSQLFIRPTNTDGLGVSIAEALYYNVPSVASNVCNRPQGTILFQSRNDLDLYRVVNDIICNHSRYVKRISKIEIKDYSNELVAAYKEIINE
ncbi:glycosyltransferase [Bacillus cereus]|uniref:glycosyltransferase family 4 protein n=1 Tax=Bacillus cereus TaxID=1396 RepID=UPI001F5D7F14|nr:glycosyltransferase family 4 protein [Bacillus cereus]MCI3147610.1 glycosyltransferase [Bacillus cereus]